VIKSKIKIKNCIFGFKKSRKIILNNYYSIMVVLSFANNFSLVAKVFKLIN
jgi:hypothetical protein